MKQDTQCLSGAAGERNRTSLGLLEPQGAELSNCSVVGAAQKRNPSPSYFRHGLQTAGLACCHVFHSHLSLDQDKEHTFHFGDPWVNEVPAVIKLGSLWSQAFLSKSLNVQGERVAASLLCLSLGR